MLYNRQTNEWQTVTRNRTILRQMFKYDTDILELLYSRTKYIMAIPGKVTRGLEIWCLTSLSTIFSYIVAGVRGGSNI